MATDEMIKIVSSYTIANQWMKTNKHLVVFEIEPIAAVAADPLEVLRQCFIRGIDEALLESIKQTGQPDRIGMVSSMAPSMPR
jgi:hypothetical protein